MLEDLRELLIPWYLHLKFFHLLFVMIWGFSTAVAYQWYIRHAWVSWSRDRGNSELIRRRNWSFEMFDAGVILEHIAFPLVIVSGLLLMLSGGWSLDNRWLMWKLLIVTTVFVPMEIIDYWLSHFGGNKARLRRQGNNDALERTLHLHWRFFQITALLIVVFVPLTIFLAVVKPG